jgi:hypothetical protein
MTGVMELWSDRRAFSVPQKTGVDQNLLPAAECLGVAGHSAAIAWQAQKCLSIFGPGGLPEHRLPAIFPNLPAQPEDMRRTRIRFEHNEVTATPPNKPFAG